MDELPDIATVDPEVGSTAPVVVPFITTEAPEDVIVAEDCVVGPPLVFVAVMSTG